MLQQLVFLLTFTHLASAEVPTGLVKLPHDAERKLEFFRPFLPLNPSIYLISKDQRLAEFYRKFWPLGSIVQDKSSNLKKITSAVDFLVINVPNHELWICNKLRHVLAKVSCIYIKTFASSAVLNQVQNYLENQNMVLLSSSCVKGNEADMVFIHNNLYEQWRKCSSFIPDSHFSCFPSLPLTNLKDFLKPALNKENKRQMDQIDFIYMINLDKRPEKFVEACAQLRPYGIKPYRFSAVNGWDLPHSVFDQVGVRLLQNPLEKWLATTFKDVLGKTERIYTSLNDTDTFFSFGMTHGTVGCILSHLSVLQDALNSGYRTIWVMEDDIEVKSDPFQIPQLIKRLNRIDPDWDILFTDADSKNTEGHYVPCLTLAYRPNFPFDPYDTYLEKSYPVDADLSRTGMRYGTYSMIVKESGIKKILNFYKKYALFLPYDMDFWLIHDLKMYRTNYDIVSPQVGSISDIAFER